MSILTKTKPEVSSLAIFGGAPTFSEKLHVGRPNIGNAKAILSRIEAILESRWLTNNGPLVQEFEQGICDRLGVRHCIAMCNATVALEILIRALALNGEVIVPSFTFIATAHALKWQEIDPVFCDIDPATHSIDPGLIESLITPRTSGIIGVHLWGRPCDIAALSEVAARHRLKLIFDAAHAFGCSHRGKMIGHFGEAEVFSFHATKFFNTFEGGAIVTNNDELAAKIRLMNNFGFAGYDKVIYIGTNGKMSDVSAAMGLEGLENIEDFIAVNRRNYELYRSRLNHIGGIKLISFDEAERNNYQYIVLEIDEAVTSINRDTLLDILWAENVMARRYFYPGCHRMEPYRTLFPKADETLPQTRLVAERVLVLPTGTAVSESQITALCQIIETVIANGAEVTRRLLSRSDLTMRATDAPPNDAEWAVPAIS